MWSLEMTNSDKTNKRVILFNTSNGGIAVTEEKSFCILSNIWNCIVYFKKWTNTRHVCTYLNATVVVIPNKVMNLDNFVIFEYLCKVFDLSSAHTAAHAYVVISSKKCSLSFILSRAFWICITIKMPMMVKSP